MFLFCCFVLPNGQEKPKLMTSLFISYDGVWCFCSFALFYQMVKRDLSLRHRFLYHMMAFDVFFCCFAFPLCLFVLWRFLSSWSSVYSNFSSEILDTLRSSSDFSAIYSGNSVCYFYFKLLTYFNSLKIMSRELHCEKEKNIILIRK
jgi:hypothetical protein